MTQDELKQAVARAAIAYVVENEIIGVGTGSTANFFIDELAKIKHKIKGTVASSEATAARLRGHGIEVFDLNDVSEMAVYIDGADEIDNRGAMIKGGGAALTREKIVASVAAVCLHRRRLQAGGRDGQVPAAGGSDPDGARLGGARAGQAGRHAQAAPETGTDEAFVTDNGGYLLDVAGLSITEPKALEEKINQIVGVIAVGLFAARGVCLLGTAEGVKTLKF
jgi:ribose 5-phosphate isomerase A